MNQQALIRPDIPLDEVARKPSLGKALEYCAELANYSYDKQLEDAMRKHGVHVDKTQLSRWQQGSEGIKWERFTALMDVCGNDAPLLWMLHARGYDLHSVRKLESETQKENRLLREENNAMRRILKGEAA